MYVPCVFDLRLCSLLFWICTFRVLLDHIVFMCYFILLFSLQMISLPSFVSSLSTPDSILCCLSGCHLLCYAVCRVWCFQSTLALAMPVFYAGYVLLLLFIEDDLSCLSTCVWVLSPVPLYRHLTPTGKMRPLEADSRPSSTFQWGVEPPRYHPAPPAPHKFSTWTPTNCTLTTSSTVNISVSVCSSHATQWFRSTVAPVSQKLLNGWHSLSDNRYAGC